MELPRKGKGVRVSVHWPDDWKEIILRPGDWESILAGHKFSEFGEGYIYEGKEYQDYWVFSGGLDGALRVLYDDGGEGFIGTLEDAEIEEVDEV
jgi:hypothetical protein